LLAGLQNNYSADFDKIGEKVAWGPEKNPLDFGGNPDHVTLGLLAGLTFHVIPGRTVLRLGESHVTPADRQYRLQYLYLYLLLYHILGCHC